MEPAVILSFLNKYGLIIVFVVVFLEYLNLPGFPAGIIMPAAGIWASSSSTNLMLTVIVSVLAGLAGSMILYILGYKGGELFLEKYLNKFPKQRPIIEKYTNKLLLHGNKTLFVSKLIPVVRTIVGFPAGVIKMPVKNYIIYSTLGIFVWNLVYIFAGFFLGEIAFQYLG